MDPVNRKGESLPLLLPNTASAIVVDGTIAHAESAPLKAGVYRIAVESVVSGGVRIVITIAGTSATANTGFYLADASSEYIAIDDNMIVSVIGGKINICAFN